jgi:ribosomal protein L7/L12
VVSTKQTSESSGHSLCFVVGPIGKDGSSERKHADLLLNAVIKHVLEQGEFNYKVKRADEDADPGMIGDRVVTDIIRSPLVVADLTDLNPNAFYELGIRHSTELPTIHVAKLGTALPFDNVAHRTIFVDLGDWHSIEQARARLADSVRATQVPDYKVSNPITQANASFKMRQSEDPKDQVIADLQERLTSLEGSINKRPEPASSGEDADDMAIVKEIVDAIHSGRKIDAIATYRRVTGVGLKEAKEFIEAIEAGHLIEATKIHRSAAGLTLKDAKAVIDILYRELRA